MCSEKQGAAILSQSMQGEQRCFREGLVKGKDTWGYRYKWVGRLWEAFATFGAKRLRAAQRLSISEGPAFSFGWQQLLNYGASFKFRILTQFHV